MVRIWHPDLGFADVPRSAVAVHAKAGWTDDLPDEADLEPAPPTPQPAAPPALTWPVLDPPVTGGHPTPDPEEES